MPASEPQGGTGQLAPLAFSLDADPGLELPRIARGFVRECTRLLDAAPTEAVLLLTSEMVTNSVKHARTERVQVTVERRGSSLRVGVLDEDPVPPVLRERDDARIGGLGLQMVDSLSTAWGIEDRGKAGKRVWFEVDAT